MIRLNTDAFKPHNAAYIKLQKGFTQQREKTKLSTYNKLMHITVQLLYSSIHVCKQKHKKIHLKLLSFFFSKTEQQPSYTHSNTYLWTLKSPNRAIIMIPKHKVKN